MIMTRIFAFFIAMTLAAPTMAEPVSHAMENAENAKKSGLPQFDPSTFASQIFWLAVMFTVLYIYFAKSALPKISSTIEQRRATVRSDLELAEKLSSDIDKTRADYESAMQGAYQDARTTITEAEDHLRHQADLQAEDFKKKSAQAVTDLENQAATAKSKIKSDLNDIAEGLTADIIATLTPLTVKDADIQKAVAAHADVPTATNTKKKAA